jgi:5-aminopentanamidase
MAVKVAVAQMDCVPADKAANLARAEHFVAAAAVQGANFVILPEMIVTGVFVADRFYELAEPIPGPATDQLCKLAARYGVYVVAGMIERDGEAMYNVSVLASPGGELTGRYRKVHQFSSEKEWFSAGDQAAIYDTRFGRVALTICYDLVFPEYIRSLVLQGAELILNSTNWITDGWQTGMGWSGEVASRLAATRALENGVHLAMANRVGVEAGWKSLGHSCICAPSGGFLARIQEGEGVAAATVELDSPEWEKWRSTATYLPDRRVALYEDLQQAAGESRRFW